MTAYTTRRTVLTGTAASAVAAAVPASAATQGTPRMEDPREARSRGAMSKEVELARHMPADPRLWIDMARASGLTVALGGSSRGERGVFIGYNECRVATFFNIWFNTRLDTGDVIAELEAEQPGPNDQRLMELAERVTYNIEEANRYGSRGTLADDKECDRLTARADAALAEMADLTPDTWHGVRAMARAVRAEPDFLVKDDDARDPGNACGSMARNIAYIVLCPWEVAGQPLPLPPSRPVEGA